MGELWIQAARPGLPLSTPAEEMGLPLHFSAQQDPTGRLRDQRLGAGGADRQPQILGRCRGSDPAHQAAPPRRRAPQTSLSGLCSGAGSGGSYPEAASRRRGSAGEAAVIHAARPGSARPGRHGPAGLRGSPGGAAAPGAGRGLQAGVPAPGAPSGLFRPPGSPRARRAPRRLRRPRRRGQVGHRVGAEARGARTPAAATGAHLCGDKGYGKRG